MWGILSPVNLKRGTSPPSSPNPGVSPSSPRSNSICRPMQMPRKGLARAASTTASRAPLAASCRMQSGMAPWPGTTTLSEERISRGPAVTRTSAFGATRSIALETDRRLPIPQSTTAIFKLQGALGRRHHAGGARVGFRRHAQGASERLEHGLALVMRVVAAQVIDVQRDLRVVDETLEELVHQVDIELADERAGELHLVGEARPAGEIDDHARQRLVERHVGVAEAAHPRFVADRLGNGLAESDADVLDRV